jgi:hypothetical protein
MKKKTNKPPTTPSQEFERNFWGDCVNTFDEDQKHYVYAHYMGLEFSGYSFLVHGQRILDIGGGPTSMLLKTLNLKEGKVCDPLDFPDWVKLRYASKNITLEKAPGEEIEEKGWDEVWIYNCLQHTTDPTEILRRAKNAAPVLRIFEWVEIPPHEGHPQMITKELIDTALGVQGAVVQCSSNGCYGAAYFGCFKF